MKYNLSSLTLTAEAIDYMTENSLVMRNSNTEQLESLHYRRFNHLSTHTPGRGKYATPLWTVSYPNLLHQIRFIRANRSSIQVFPKSQTFDEDEYEFPPESPDSIQQNT